MSELLNVLVIEDDLLTVDPVLRAFEYVSDSNGLINFTVNVANNCDSALEAIHKAARSKPLDLVLLDINLEPSADKKYLCGTDLGIEIKRLFVKAKIVVMTSHNSNYRINNILKSLDPFGFLIKSETDFLKLTEALTAVIDDHPYYSKPILQLMRRHITNDFTLDRIDRQILYFISKGFKMNGLAKQILLSTSAIEVRKRNMKELLGVSGGDDKDLIIRAEECGFL